MRNKMDLLTLNSKENPSFGQDPVRVKSKNLTSVLRAHPSSTAPMAEIALISEHRDKVFFMSVKHSEVCITSEASTSPKNDRQDAETRGLPRFSHNHSAKANPTVNYSPSNAARYARNSNIKREGIFFVRLIGPKKLQTCGEKHLTLSCRNGSNQFACRPWRF